jgi:hypothetical protein
LLVERNRQFLWVCQYFSNLKCSGLHAWAVPYISGGHGRMQVPLHEAQIPSSL